jgi:pimeloyl-ACP methyl ester carboxylesterase
VAGEAMMRALFGPDFELIPADWIEQAKRIHTRPGILRAGMHEIWHVGEDMGELEGSLGEVDVPTVVVSAELDRNVPARVDEALVAAMPGVRPVFVPNAAHAFVQARPQEVRRLVDDVMVHSSSACMVRSFSRGSRQFYRGEPNGARS